MSYPTFHEAEAQLRDFLGSNKWPTEIAWIRVGDVATLGSGLILHPSINGDLHAVKVYQEGIQKNLGIQLQGICCDGHRSYCLVWGPSDDTEAEYALMPQGLKLSVLVSPRHVKVARGRLLWWWLRRKALPWQS
jgi:hypothetical protein